jgi:hypothetical protein
MLASAFDPLVLHHVVALLCVVVPLIVLYYLARVRAADVFVQYSSELLIHCFM